MLRALSVHERWHGAPTAVAPQVLACAFCVLLRWEHDDLSAPFWRWYLNDRPGAWLTMKDKRIPLEPGQVVLIPPHSSLGTGCRGPVGHLYLHFALGLDRTVAPGGLFFHTPSEMERETARRLIAELEAGPTGAGLRVSFLAQALINPALAALPADYWSDRAPDPRIEQALRALRAGEADDNASLARVAGMNVNAFIRKFRQATGHPPHRYRLRLRIEQACGWLREGRMGIEEIAEAAGFCDRYHFSRVFRAMMGAGPAEFRRRMSPPAGGAAKGR